MLFLLCRPNGVITLVSSLATKVHKTLHSIDTDETMVRIALSFLLRFRRVNSRFIVPPP